MRLQWRDNKNEPIRAHCTASLIQTITIIWKKNIFFEHKRIKIELIEIDNYSRLNNKLTFTDSYFFIWI